MLKIELSSEVLWYSEVWIIFHALTNSGINTVVEELPLKFYDLDVNTPFEKLTQFGRVK